MALGVALAGLGALLGWFLLTGLNKQVAVVVAARDVPIGTVLSSGDLGTAMVSADGAVKTVPGAQLTQLVGMVTAVDLRSGTLLSRSQLTGALKPAAGQQLVSIPLKISQIPARGYRPGDLLLVTATPGQGTQDGGKPILPDPVPATVDRVGTSRNDVVVVDLLVDSASGVAVSQQASTGRIALLLQPRSS